MRQHNRIERMTVASRRRTGFSLVELLTVIAVLALLASILFPVLGKVRQGADKAQCASNLHQIGSAILMYSAENGGYLPGKTVGLYGQIANEYNTRNRDIYQLITYLLPYLGIGSGEGTADVMTCPASADILTTAHASYLANPAVLLVDGTTARPFGKDYGIASPAIMSRIANPSNAVAIFDLDAEIWRTLGNAEPRGVPLKPVHGNTRNFLYLDGHVAAQGLDYDPRAIPLSL